MSQLVIHFKKDGRIYKAQAGATIINLTDKKPAGVSVREIVSRGNNKYGILLFSGSPEWESNFEVENLEDFDL